MTSSAEESADSSSPGESGPEWRVWIRFGVTLIATVLLAFFGFSRAPHKVVDPPIATGKVIVLTDQSNVSVNVQVSVSQTAPFGVGQQFPPVARDSTWMSVFVSQPLNLTGTSAILPHRRWALLLEDFPALRTPPIVGLLRERMTVIPLRRAAGATDNSTASRAAPPDSHDYLIVDDSTEASADFAVAGPHLVVNNQDGLVNATFPTVDAFGSVFAASFAAGAFGPFQNAPSSAPDQPAVLKSVTGFLDFPATQRPDNLALVAGVDASTRVGSSWSWSSASGIHVLLQDADVRRSEDHDLFWSGLLIGSAAAAGIACLLELIDLGASYRRRVAAPRPP
jgi:hypothetical protein